MPFFDNTIEIARRSMESKALLMSTKWWWSYDLKHGTCQVYNVRPLFVQLLAAQHENHNGLDNNCGSMMSRMRPRRRLVVRLAKATLYAIPRSFSKDYELPFIGIETIMLFRFVRDRVITITKDWVRNEDVQYILF